MTDKTLNEEETAQERVTNQYESISIEKYFLKRISIGIVVMMLFFSIRQNDRSLVPEIVFDLGYNIELADHVEVKGLKTYIEFGDTYKIDGIVLKNSIFGWQVDEIIGLDEETTD